MYALPFEISSLKQLRIDTLKASQGHNEVDLTRIPNGLVNLGIFLSVNYITPAKVVPTDSQKSQRLSRFQNLSLTGSMPPIHPLSKSESPRKDNQRISLAVHFARYDPFASLMF